MQSWNTQGLDNRNTHPLLFPFENCYLPRQNPCSTETCSFPVCFRIGLAQQSSLCLHGTDWTFYFITLSAKSKITRYVFKHTGFLLLAQISPSSSQSQDQDLLSHSTATGTKSGTSRLGCQAARTASHTMKGRKRNYITVFGGVG